MNSSKKGQCRRCGAVIPVRSTDRLCPACLLSAAMEPPGDDAETAGIGAGETPTLTGSSDSPTRLTQGPPESPATNGVVSTLPGEPLAHDALTQFPRGFGGYRLLGLLGRGGMGTVYDAEDLNTGRRVALKMLGKQLDSPDMRHRFLREGRLAAGINHPNSLYVFGSEEIKGIPVITMEIASGGTLHDKLKQGGPMPVPEAVDAVLDIISGLESACARGVLHRDIKPSNCFVCRDGSVKVGDFGLSVSTTTRSDTLVTAAGTIMGTPAYASPEQLRGDTLDLRADVYSVGATLFTLLTNRAPFEGDNAVQVVANAVNKEPKPLRELRADVPSGLERVVARCLAKEPDQRYSDYAALRRALLPFSSRELEPASMKVRAAAAWFDYLIAFLIPYVVLVLLVGPEDLLIRPLVERSLYSARYYLAVFCFGFVYFSLAEGIWGAGLGKRLKGLRVVRGNSRRPPGVGRALIRILIPILSVEAVRVPLMMALITDADMTRFQVVLFVLAACVCAWIPILLTLSARRENGFASVWDLVSGTRVVLNPEGVARPFEAAAGPETQDEGGDWFGPYRLIEELVPGKWVVASDPLLRRQVWLLRRDGRGPSAARRNLARFGRLRWLQKVEAGEATWDAYEATRGTPFSKLVEGGERVPWSKLRHWLHDLASELWDATGDQTLPAELSLDHVWITEQGNAVLLDEPWPGPNAPAELIPVGDLAGQQRFLNAVAVCVDSTGLPLHARPALRNLREGKFEKLSFLTGILRGFLDRPAEVGRGIRAASIFMLPLYIWILVFIGAYQDQRVRQWSDSLGVNIVVSIVVLLGGAALIQLVGLPFRSTASHSIFRLAVVNAKGVPAGVSDLLLRWAVVWLPLLVPMLGAGLLWMRGETTTALISALALILLWTGAVGYSVVHPNRGLHDRLAGTWVVRR